MQHIITDEEADRFVFIRFQFSGSNREADKAALADFLNNRPESTLGKLRPIAEMPETVPEGCVRMFVYRHASGCFGGPFFIHSTGERFNFFADIQLPTPDPDAEERRQFEEAMKKLYPLMDLTRDKSNTGPSYIRDNANCMWIGFQLAKKGGDK